MKKSFVRTLMFLSTVGALLLATACGPDALSEPTITTSETSIDFGTISGTDSFTAEKTITATVKNYTGALVAAVTEGNKENFTVSTSAANGETTIKVQFNAKQAGNYAAVLNIAAGKVSVNVPLKAEAKKSETPIPETNAYFVYQDQPIANGATFTVLGAENEVEKEGDGSFMLIPKISIATKTPGEYDITFVAEQPINGQWCLGSSCILLKNLKTKTLNGVSLSDPLRILDWDVKIASQTEAKNKVTFTLKRLSDGEIYTATLVYDLPFN